jgi:pimeloyl-ACP methyl ester carboxylesterase
MLERIAAKAGETDRAFFADPACTAIFLDTFREAFRFGSLGAARDGQLYAMPWGFRLEEIRASVLLWHGERDTVVPVAFGRHVASRIPGCRATFYPDEGHFSIAVRRADEIVAAFEVDGAAGARLSP